ncbi:MAG: ATP-binding protein [Bacilli bacterium]|nr:ATP-binding protein [Bacilli bacterium]
MKYIKRLIEDILNDRFENSKCVLVSGTRQVGKSTLLKHLYSNINYVTFDDLLFKNLANDDPKLFISNLPKPSILDEVQYTPNIFHYIKMECDNANDNGNYLLTSSQQMKIMEKAKESLAGRVSILELQTLCLREINNIDFNKHFIPTNEYILLREQKLKKYNNIWGIIHRGMYPELYRSNRDWIDFYSSYVKTYVERDVFEEINIKDEITFTKFLISIASRTGQLLNKQNIAYEVGVSAKTIDSWLSILEKTGLIYILEPYYSNHLTRAIKTPKIYFKDTGLACYLTRWTTPEALENGAMAGHMFETFVVNEIIKSFTNEGKEYQFNLFYYRGKDNDVKENEIDLIIEENGILYPIEIKKSANPTLSMAKAFKVLDKEIEKKRGQGAIVCLYDKKILLREDVVVLPIEYI